MSGISASARLLRGFAVDFLTCHDPSVVPRIMDPAYRLSIGGFVLEGRDDSYLPATAAQLEQFSGLVVTVHDVVLGPNAVAMRFTEHGVSVKNGRAAAWGGVTLFRIRNGRLAQGWAEEDYFARKRQLASGEGDAVRPPMLAPWDVPAGDPDAATQAAARVWLADAAAIVGGSVYEISEGGPRLAELAATLRPGIPELFTAANRAAFHLECAATYAGGFADIDPAHIGTPVTIRIAGLLTIAEGHVTRAQICVDRLGLHRHLLGTRA